MKYLFTTLAVGKPYLENAIDCYLQMSKVLNCDFNITTNEELKNISNINFDYFSLNRYHDDRPGFSFYLNLKVLALKYALDKGYDFVIYNDGGLETHKKFNETKNVYIIRIYERQGF